MLTFAHPNAWHFIVSKLKASLCSIKDQSALSLEVGFLAPPEMKTKLTLFVL